MELPPGMGVSPQYWRISVLFTIQEPMDSSGIRITQLLIGFASERTIQWPYLQPRQRILSTEFAPCEFFRLQSVCSSQPTSLTSRLESGTALGQAYSSPDGLSYEAVGIPSLDVNDGMADMWDSRCSARYCYDLELHYNHQGRSRPAEGQYYPHASVNFGFEQCRSRCERVALANEGNQYLGLDLTPGTTEESLGENLCYCLFETQPICPDDLPNCRATSPADASGLDSAVCVMTVERGGAGAAIVASWRQSLVDDGFILQEDLGSGLYIQINAGEADGIIYQLSMHCKTDTFDVTLPAIPAGDERTLELGLCVYGSSVHTAAATISGNPFTAIRSSNVADPQLMYADNPYWELKGFEGTPCNNGGIFLQAPTAYTVEGEVVSVMLNQLQNFGATPAEEHLPLSRCQGDCDADE